MNEKLARRLGWLGLVSLLSYTAAVVISPMAYPGYDWMSQAVSDLSADTAPSRVLWSQLGALYKFSSIETCQQPPKPFLVILAPELFFHSACLFFSVCVVLQSIHQERNLR